MYKFALFDLDGTLTDPGIGITNSVMHALKRMNIPVGERNEYYKFIGPPLLDSFREYYGLSDEGAKLGVTYYREYFAEKGIFENDVYPGIVDTLDYLVKHNITLCVATSKPEPYAKQILEHFNLSKYFSFIGGSTMDETRTDKAEVIQYVLKQAGINNLKDVIMIGDREHDMIGAAKNHLDSVGVLYGYGDREELENAGAKYVVENPGDIVSIVCGG